MQNDTFVGYCRAFLANQRFAEFDSVESSAEKEQAPFLKGAADRRQNYGFRKLDKSFDQTFSKVCEVKGE